MGLQSFRFKTVVADPPWPYNDATKGAIVKVLKNDGTRSIGVHVENRYETMSVEDLKALPVSSHLSNNAHLYLWTTNAFMVEAHELARAWGFIPKTIITWGKVKEDGTPSMKTGYYFRGATEHALFCVRGSLPLAEKMGQPTLLLERRLPHSVKPEAFFSLVERNSPGPYLELFARRVRPGWDAWGDEVESTISLSPEQ